VSNEHYYYYYMGFVDAAHLGPDEMSSSSGAAAHMQRDSSLGNPVRRRRLEYNIYIRGTDLFTVA